jgi:hypothetical protein
MAEPQTVCALCSKPVRPDQAAMFRDGTIIHLPCGSRGAVLRSMELEAEIRAAQQRAADLAEWARQIMAKSRGAPGSGGRGRPAAGDAVTGAPPLHRGHSRTWRSSGHSRASPRGRLASAFRFIPSARHGTVAREVAMARTPSSRHELSALSTSIRPGPGPTAQQALLAAMVARARTCVLAHHEVAGRRGGGRAGARADSRAPG